MLVDARLRDGATILSHLVELLKLNSGMSKYSLNRRAFFGQNVVAPRTAASSTGPVLTDLLIVNTVLASSAGFCVYNH